MWVIGGAILLAVLSQVAQGDRVEKLMLFGGHEHDVYLGCLNCTASERDAIANPYSKYGRRSNSTSIYNRYSRYGDAHSSTSVCNKYAKAPPVIVDQQGRFYGYLTLNSRLRGATRDTTWLAFLAGLCR